MRVPPTSAFTDRRACATAESEKRATSAKRRAVQRAERAGMVLPREGRRWTETNGGGRFSDQKLHAKRAGESGVLVGGYRTLTNPPRSLIFGGTSAAISPI